MRDYVIVANSSDFLVREIIEEAIKDKIIIALDGAANKLLGLGILPNVILGDFDSIKNVWGIKQTFNELDEKAQPYQGRFGTTIVPAKNQNLTDLVKAIQYCDEQGATSITLICATGGRLDHHEGTMMALRSEYRENRVITLHTEQQTLRFAKDETVHLSGNIGDKCGVVATFTGTFTSEGLEYEGNHHAESICNALKNTNADIHIEGSGLMIMPPQLVAQREYMKKSKAEQLKLQLRDAELIDKKIQQLIAKQEKPGCAENKILTYGIFAATCAIGVAAYCALSVSRHSPGM